jgi:hypothetical protein
MSAIYTQIQVSEITDFFKKWSRVQNDAQELVYDYPIRDGVVVRCATSVHVVRGVSRKKGQDAIRIYAVDIKNNNGYIKSKRVNRTQNWRENIKKKYADILMEAKMRLAHDGR